MPCIFTASISRSMPSETENTTSVTPSSSNRKGVTEFINPGHVFEMTWTPERAGNWLFHCHMMMHMSAPAALHPKEAQPASYSEHDHSGGMGGLVIGITVLPGAIPAAASVVTKAPRKLQLVISENPEKVPLYQLQVNDPQVPSESDKTTSPRLLGPPILLTRGEED